MSTSHEHAYAMTMMACLLGVCCFPLAAESIEWNLDDASQVVSAVNLEPGSVENGRLRGWSAWDPYVYFRLPKEGIDAEELSWLRVRLYSSTEADLLDIYYKSPDGRWCLGGKYPISKGWATYTVDLTKNDWRETRSGEVSKQWGGPSKRVSSFRLDPGNQEGRWVMIDSVWLGPPKPGLEEGIEVEPRGSARLRTLTVPKSVQAGEKLRVAGDFEISVPDGLERGTGFVRLRQGPTLMRIVEQPVDLTGKTIDLRAEVPTSPYWYPGTLSLEVGCYELDPAEGSPPATREIALTNPRVGTAKPPVAELRQLGGNPAIFVNGKPMPGFMYASHGGLHLDYHREIAQAGIHLYSDWFGTSRGSDMGHVGKDEYNYGEFDRYFAAILDVDPQAYFLPHIGVTAPLWWQEMHPEELCEFEDGSRGPSSFASELWKKEMGRDLRRLIAYLRKAPYADRIIGILFYGGYTAEWQMWGTWQPSRGDYSRPALKAFRRFLAEKYRTDEGLRIAWGDDKVTLASAEMPKWDKRRPGGPQVLRDPNTERQAMDFYEFISNMTADALLHFARIAREATEGRSLVGTYYAYLSAHGINQQDSGHLAAARVFDSPYIDFLMSPPNYWYRKPGEASTFMSATDSLRMRGKLWLDEADNRTFLTDPGAGYGRADTLEETLGVFWREFAEVLCKRAAVSWFDMRGGWFSHPEILSAMGRAHEVAQESLPAREVFQAEVGVFVDPESFYWMRSTDANRRLVLNQLTLMPQAGAPFDFCLLSDIGQPWLPDYRLYVFLNAIRVDSQMRLAIVNKLKRNNATALFVYAPGYFGSEAAPIENMWAVTGIQLAIDKGAGTPQLTLDAADPLAKGFTADQVVGADLQVAPVIYADDVQVRVVGRLAGTDRAGLVVKKQDGWTSVYSAAMELPSALVRNLAREAGVHIWLETDDALYADGQFVGVHAATEGEKVLRLPAACRAFEVVSGRAVPVNGQTVTLRMKRAQTVLLRLELTGGEAP